MASSEQRINQFTRRKIKGKLKGNKGELKGNLFKFLNFSKISKNPGKWPVLNIELINLQEGKFEVPEQEYFRICLNF